VLVGLAVAVRGGPTVRDVADHLLVALRVGPLDGLLDAVDLAGSLPMWAFAVALLTVMLAPTGVAPGCRAFVIAVGVRSLVSGLGDRTGGGWHGTVSQRWSWRRRRR